MTTAGTTTMTENC